MITISEFLVRVRIDRHLLESWIAAGWLIPRREPELIFSDIDLARAQLIRELKEDFGVNDEGISLILHLLDQIHGLRRSMHGTLEEMRRRQQPGGPRARRPLDEKDLIELIGPPAGLRYVQARRVCRGARSVHDSSRARRSCEPRCRSLPPFLRRSPARDWATADRDR
jgi:chaperone modulatory protein CbpM